MIASVPHRGFTLHATAQPAPLHCMDRLLMLDQVIKKYIINNNQQKGRYIYTEGCY
jgi:hypothetical protein